MVTQIYINLDVKKVDKSTKFFKKLGFKFNPTFTDKNAACMIIGKNIYSMLVARKYFKTFTNRKLSNAKKYTEVLLAIDAKSRKAVDVIVNKALASGAKPNKPASDYGWMYSRNFSDLDGHIWEVLYMNQKALQKQLKEAKKKKASEIDK